MRRLLVVGIIGLLLLATGIAVLAKPETAVATLIVTEGQATITQNRARFGFLPSVTAVTLNVGNLATISQGDVISQDSGVGQLRLYDGSTVDLMAGTQLAMTELIITSTDYRVQLQLLAGQTVNRVVKLLGADDYFRVSTPSSTAAVRGTLFTVEVVSETATVVMVDEGIVRVSMGTEMVDVSAGQMVTAVVGQLLQVQPQPSTRLPLEPTPAEQPALPAATLQAMPQLTTPGAIVLTPTNTPTSPVTTQVAPTPRAITPTSAGTTAAVSPTSVIPAATLTVALPTATQSTAAQPTLPATALPTAVPPTATRPGQPTTLPTATVAHPIPTNTPAPQSTSTQVPPPTTTTAPTATTAPTVTPQPAPTATPTLEPPTPTPELVTLCHIPGGNPDNAQTIEVNPDEVNGHLGHGDYLGPCQ